MCNGVLQCLYREAGGLLGTYHISPQLHKLGTFSTCIVKLWVRALRGAVTLILRALVFGKLAGGSRSSAFGSPLL